MLAHLTVLDMSLSWAEQIWCLYRVIILFSTCTSDFWSKPFDSFLHSACTQLCVGQNTQLPTAIYVPCATVESSMPKHHCSIQCVGRNGLSHFPLTWIDRPFWYQCTIYCVCRNDLSHNTLTCIDKLYWCTPKY